MPKPDAPALVFYPAHCFSASPTYNTWVKLTAAGVLALQERRGFEGQNVYFHYNHPIQWVQVVGIVVSVNQLESFWSFHIDDGSGLLLEVSMRREQPAKLPHAGPGQLIGPLDEKRMGISDLGNKVDLEVVKLGTLVKVKGGLKKFRGEFQISMERLFLLPDTAAEAQYWSDLAKFYRSTLTRPWQLSSEQRQELRNRDIQAAQRTEKKRARKIKQAVSEKGESAKAVS